MRDDSGAMATSAGVEKRWYRGATKNQWRTFSAAYLGWMLDIMDLMIFSMVIGHIVTEFGSDRGTAGAIASFTLVASAFGGLVFGLIADRIGRTKAMVASILCYSVGTFLCGLTTDMGMLLVARIVVGLGVGGEWGAGTALVTETWPARHRGKVVAWVQSAFATGYALAALITLLVVPTLGWRWAFFAGILPAIVAFWIRRATRESEMWLEAGERLSAKQSIKQLFSANPKAVVVCIGFTALAMCGYWGLFTWIPNYLGSPVDEGGRGMGILSSTTWIIVMQVGAAAGFISFGYVADRIGRRWAFILYFTAAALCVPVFILIENEVLMLVFGAVMSLFGTGFYSGFGPTLAELFPTEIRAFAQGFIYNTGRAASALAPMLVGVMATNLGVGMALTGTAGFYLLAAIVVLLFLPETKGQELTTGTGAAARVPRSSEA
ncbi:MFS transporter [Prauserella cavernicola]|uniref:MFS transporter n=1 Tax=Prauserella cavernicola TaxID=2800127 RepID=A0A934QZ40_9PSEU|nr:MFS transporter [Prauserella cavernicola]MBK1787949.1 MFS transporter [Prauserella cavernicola]